MNIQDIKDPKGDETMSEGLFVINENIKTVYKGLITIQDLMNTNKLNKDDKGKEIMIEDDKHYQVINKQVEYVYSKIVPTMKIAKIEKQDLRFVYTEDES